MDPISPSIDFAILADAAQAVGGKLHVLGGGWDTLRVQQVPVQHHTLSLGMRVRIPWGSAGQEMELAVEFQDEDGHAVFERGPIRHQFKVRRPKGVAEGADIGMVRALTFNNLRIPDFGGYSFVISVDGEELDRVRFRVIPAVTPS